MFETFTQELYYRGVRFFNDRTLKYLEKQESSIRPVVARKFEKVRFPHMLTSRDLLSFYTGMLIINVENDLVCSEVLDSILKKAQRHQNEPSWEIWFRYAYKFNITENYDIKQKNRTETCFDIRAWFDFLQENFSDDEIFGNILDRASKLMTKCYRVEDRFKTRKHKVNWPQRKRGYNDKGHYAPFFKNAWRLCQIEEGPNPEVVKFESMLQIQVFPHDPDE